MNRIFKVIKNACGQYVVASEFAKQSGKNKALKLLLPLATFSTMASASIVSDIVPYEEYRNFAENKGKYTVGATDIPIYDKNNILLGNLFPDARNQDWELIKIPMPDFSPSHSITYRGRTGQGMLGVSSLVHPQYVTTVQHNEIQSADKLEFGDIFSTTKRENNYQYIVTNANDAEPNFDFLREWSEGFNKYNFSLPRLSKLVTEIVPTETAVNEEKRGCYFISSYWDCSPLGWGNIVRLGSGKQYVYSAEGGNQNLEYVSDASKHLVGGGILGKIMLTEPNGNYFYVSSFDRPLTLKEDMSRENIKILPTLVTPSDGGAPLYVYDSYNKKWKLAGLAYAATGITNDNINDKVQQYFTVYKPEFLNRYLAQHKGVELNLDVEEVNWREIGQGKSIIADNELDISLSDDIAGAENGKDLYINGGAIDGEQLLQPLTINLESDIDQGAGGIYVGNIRPSYVKIKTDNDSSWVGSGIVVHKGSVLDWQVYQPFTARRYEQSSKQDINFSGDRLSKLGQGTLRIMGSNPRPTGNLSIGDGQVIIGVGNEPAFHNIELVSGRGVLTLSDAQSMNSGFGNNYWADSNSNTENSDFIGNIGFGYRGGKLDLNGKNAGVFYSRDEGTNIVNHNPHKTSTLYFSGWMKGLVGSRGYSVCSYDENPIISVRYFDKLCNSFNTSISVATALRDDNRDELKLLMKDAESLSRKGIPSWWGIGGENIDLYRSQFTLNDVQVLNGKLNIDTGNSLFSGGLHLNGNLNINGGKTVFSGHRIESEEGADNWLTRDFIVKAIEVKNQGVAEIGRNVGAFLVEKIELGTNTTLNLGVNSERREVCYGNENNNACTVHTLDANSYEKLPQTYVYVDGGIKAFRDGYVDTVNGDTEANINVGKAFLYGHIGPVFYYNIYEQFDGSDTNDKRYTTPNVTLSKDAIWQLAYVYNYSGLVSESDGVSYVDRLHLEQGSKIYLNSENEFNKFNKLVVGSLSGNGFFRFNTNLAKLVGNLVEVTYAAGSHTISILDSGEEIKRENAETLKLFDIKGNNSATFKLEKGYVDAGAFRYYLNNLKNLVQLDTSEEAKNQADAELNKAQEEADRQRQEEEERKRQEEAERQRQAEEERKRQEEAERQRQAEEERKRQQEADRQRQAEEERKRQEEADR
ncbi:S6 family peptidase, partial [Ursidibacter arcticus]